MTCVQVQIAAVCYMFVAEHNTQRIPLAVADIVKKVEAQDLLLGEDKGAQPRNACLHQ